MFNQTLIPVLTTKSHVAIGCDCAETILGDFHNGDIKRPSTKVIHQHVDRLINFSIKVNPALLVTVGNCCRGWLVDNVENIETADVAGVLGCFAANLVEIGRDCDDGAVKISDYPRGIFF